jgi:RNA polymerase sigma-70 factor (ECF subfamily)
LKTAPRICIDFLRKRKQDPSDLLVEPVSPQPENLFRAMEFSQVLSRLPSRQREAIYLHYFLGFSLKEVAEITGVSLFTAASRCRLGVKKLKEHFGEES